MMKIKWTMFKKMFVVMVMAFMFVNCVTVYVDYCTKISELEDNMENRTKNFFGAERLSKEFSQYKHKLNDEAFLKSLDKHVDISDLNAWFQYIIVDDGFNIIDYTNVEGNYISFTYELDDYASASNTWSLNNFNLGERQHELENKIRKLYKEGKDIGVNYILENDQIVYLAIADIVLEEKNDSRNYKTTVLHEYHSDNIYYIPDKLLEYNEYFKEIVNQVKKREAVSFEGNMISYDGKLRQNVGVVKNDNDLLSYSIFPLLKNDVEFSFEKQYSLEDIEGYIIAYNYKSDIYSAILDEVVYGSMTTVAISVLVTIMVCIIVAYSFSRRIQEIEKATNKISENVYDINLKVDTTDEIGSLSNNINIMSTKIKDTIQELNNELEHVKRLEEMKSEFIANFTHEIKTPLSIINGYIELIDECKDDVKKKEYLLAINKEIDHINHLVLSMLNLSRLQSHNIKLNIEEIDVDELITSTIDSLDLLIKKKNIKVIVESDSSKILGDYKELTTVMNNFISNAIKYTVAQGSIIIKVKDCILSIENEGSHIEEKDKDKIWDTYVSSDRNGTGLGLAINKAILDLHDFKYNVYNTKIGVCFEVKCKRGG